MRTYELKMESKLFTILTSMLLITGVTQASCPENDGYDEALLIALLALHHGDDCELVVQRGAQQIAALELEINKINSDSEDDIKLDLKVFDTCSSPDEAVKATLEAMVYKEQTCQRPPLFLGFLGPDDQENLRSVTKVSNVFKLTHVVPSALRNYGQFNAMNVEMIDPAERAKAITLLLKNLNWSSFTLIHTSDSTTTQLAIVLLQSNKFCISEPLYVIPTSTSAKADNSGYANILQSLEQGKETSILLITDTAESAKRSLKVVSGLSTRFKFIIYVQSSGILPWTFSEESAKEVLILQETSKSTMIPPGYRAYLENTTLWTTYIDQLESDQILCVNKNQQACVQSSIYNDNTITPLIYAMHLYSHALKSAFKNKCNTVAHGNRPVICNQMLTMSPEEWRSILEGTVAYVRDDYGDNHKARFYMELDNDISVLFYNTATNLFEEIGSINNGKYLTMKSVEGLPTQLEQKARHCINLQEMTVTTKPETKLKPAEDKKKTDEDEEEEDDEDDDEDSGSIFDRELIIFGFDLSSNKLGQYEVIAILAGAAFGGFLVFIVITCLVYRCVRVKNDNKKSESSSVPGSPTGGGRNKKNKRKNHQSFRSDRS